MKRLPIVLVLVLLTASFTGCAFGNRHVQLQYAPEAQELAAQKSQPLPGHEIVILPFEDSRPFEHVGHVKNGFGIKTAKVKAEGDVGEWVVGAIAAELTEQGFTVLEKDQPGSLVMNGNVTNVYCTAYASYRAEIEVFVSVLSNGKEILNRRYESNIKGDTNWAASSKSFHNILTVALEDVATEIAWDLKSVVRMEE